MQNPHRGPHDASPGSALTPFPWAPWTSLTVKGMVASPWDQGTPAARVLTGVSMGSSTLGGARASRTLWRLVCHCFSSGSSVLPCTCKDFASLLASWAADPHTLQHLRVCSCACKGGRGFDICPPEILSSMSPASTVFKLWRPPT